MTGEERTAQIDRELDRSLGVFDDELRKEQGIIAQRRGARDGSGGSGGGGEGGDAERTAQGTGGAAAGGGGQEGGMPGSAGAGGGNNQKGGAAGSGAGGENGDGQGKEGGSATGGQRGGGGGVGGGARGGNGPTTVPADIPDGSDDDIVARQLREAAMQETDPELREKLWQEYRNYKKGAK
ncbi:MAG TPA: hypothetical protein VJS42_06465 [Steroidobacteraceae bacterium]|nr:hypothetical protein [Steroidobacteraceae bacterium]